MRYARQSVQQLDLAMLELRLVENVIAPIRIPTRAGLETATRPVTATQQQTVVEDGPSMFGNWEVAGI